MGLLRDIERSRAVRALTGRKPAKKAAKKKAAEPKGARQSAPAGAPKGMVAVMLPRRKAKEILSAMIEVGDELIGRAARIEASGETGEADPKRSRREGKALHLAAYQLGLALGEDPHSFQMQALKG